MTLLEYILDLVLNLGLFAVILGGLLWLLTGLGVVVSGWIIGTVMSRRTYPYLMEHQRGFSYEYNEEASKLDMETRLGVWRGMSFTVIVVLLWLLLLLRPSLDVAFTVFGLELHIWSIVIIAAVLTANVLAGSILKASLIEKPIVVVDFDSYDPETDLAKYKIRMSEKWLNDMEPVIEMECEHDDDFIKKYCHDRSKFVVTDVMDGRLVFMELNLRRWMGADEGD